MDTVDIVDTFDNISITDIFEVVDTVDVLENINGCPHKLPGQTGDRKSEHRKLSRGNFDESSERDGWRTSG